MQIDADAVNAHFGHYVQHARVAQTVATRHAGMPPHLSEH